MTTLTITSRNQGFGYDEASALAALSIFHRAALLIGAALLTVRGLKSAAQALRPAHA